MKDINMCNVVFDLLPTYVDGLASVDSKKLIEDHIRNCSNCSRILENMNSDVIEKNVKKDESIEENLKLIDAFKKIKKRNILINVGVALLTTVFFLIIIFCLN